jgi:hypothetical protein
LSRLSKSNDGSKVALRMKWSSRLNLLAIMQNYWRVRRKDQLRHLRRLQLRHAKTVARRRQRSKHINIRIPITARRSIDWKLIDSDFEYIRV